MGVCMSSCMFVCVWKRFCCHLLNLSPTSLFILLSVYSQSFSSSTLFSFGVFNSLHLSIPFRMPSDFCSLWLSIMSHIDPQRPLLFGSASAINGPSTASALEKSAPLSTSISSNSLASTGTFPDIDLGEIFDGIAPMKLISMTVTF